MDLNKKTLKNQLKTTIKLVNKKNFHQRRHFPNVTRRITYAVFTL